MKKLLEKVIAIGNEAAKAVMQIYEKDFAVEYKEDESPLTVADKTAHSIIDQGLKNTGYPVVSEESKQKDLNKISQNTTCFWLVDPLDGTKEFIKKNGEFTINIALVNDSRPVLGIVLIPAQNKIYYAIKDEGAFKLSGGILEKLYCSNVNKLSESTIAVSRSHLKNEDRNFIENNIIRQTKPLGSALKYCEIAEGNVDISIRFTPLMQWDLAASDIIVHEAGGAVVDFQNKVYQYNATHSNEALIKGLIVLNQGIDYQDCQF